MRKRVAARLTALAVALALGTWTDAVAAGTDGAIVEGSFSFTPGLGPLEQPSVGITFSGACPLLPVPTYVDAPGDANPVTTGVCGSFSMSGTLLNASCGAGEGSGSYSLSEPSGEVVSGRFSVVMAGAMAVFVLTGQADDGGTGGGLALFEITWPVLANSPPGGTCVAGVSSAPGTGVVVGLHT